MAEKRTYSHQELFEWIKKVISKCENLDQLQCCNSLIDIYEKKNVSPNNVELLKKEYADKYQILHGSELPKKLFEEKVFEDFMYGQKTLKELCETHGIKMRECRKIISNGLKMKKHNGRNGNK